MPATYEKIATTTLSSAANNITFSSISSAYTDLRLVVIGTVSVAGDNPAMQFNSDTGTNYSNTELRGNGTAAASSRNTSYSRLQFSAFGGWSTTIPMMATADIFSYAGSTNKTVLTTYAGDSNGSGLTAVDVGLWRSTSAINSIKIYPENGNNFSIGTTATLYGILRA